MTSETTPRLNIQRRDVHWPDTVSAVQARANFNYKATNPRCANCEHQVRKEHTVRSGCVLIVDVHRYCGLGGFLVSDGAICDAWERKPAEVAQKNK